MEADLYGFGTVYYDESQMANVLGFAPMVDKGYRIQYDSNIGDKFIVTAPDGEQTTFNRTPEGLYAFKPSPEFLKEVAKAKGMKPRTELKRHQSHVIETVKGVGRNTVRVWMVAHLILVQQQMTIGAHINFITVYY